MRRSGNKDNHRHSLFCPVAAAPIRPYKSPLQSVPKDCQRIWDETRPNLGRDATESGARHDSTWEEARLNAGRRSLTGIGCGLAGCLVCKPMVFAKSGRLPHHSLIVNTPKYSIAFHILQYGLHGMLTVFLLIKHQNQCCQKSKQIISASRTFCHKKALTLWQNIKLWVQTVLTRRCTILWSRQKKEQYLFLMISQRAALPMLYGRD